MEVATAVKGKEGEGKEGMSPSRHSSLLTPLFSRGGEGGQMRGWKGRGEDGTE